MFNNVTLIGYLGSDAQSRTTRNNSTLTVLSLATKRSWKNRQTGQRDSQTTWHKCVSFGRPSVVCAAADAVSEPPAALRPSLIAALERAQALGLSVDELVTGLRGSAERPSRQPSS